MLRFALLGTAAAVFARSAAVDWATCPPGWSAIAYDVHGGGKVWHVGVARIGECADMCRETDGCTAFEFSDEDHTCGTYTDGPRNIDVDHLEVANVTACALPRQAMLLSFTFDGARLAEGRPDGTLVEAVSFVDSFDQLYGARWLYHAPGSGFFLDLGRTLAVETHDAVNARFGVACPCHIYISFDICQEVDQRYHTSLCPVVAPAAVNAARASGYDTIQILSHDLDLVGARTGKTEFIDLQQPYIANPPQGTVLRNYYATRDRAPCRKTVVEVKAPFFGGAIDNLLTCERPRASEPSPSPPPSPPPAPPPSPPPSPVPSPLLLLTLVGLFVAISVCAVLWSIFCSRVLCSRVTCSRVLCMRLCGARTSFVTLDERNDTIGCSDRSGTRSAAHHTAGSNPNSGLSMGELLPAREN